MRARSMVRCLGEKTRAAHIGPLLMRCGAHLPSLTHASTRHARTQKKDRSHARIACHHLSSSPTKKKITTPSRTGRWDGLSVVIGQGSVGCQHLAAFHTHLCNRAQRLMAKLCKGMTMDVDDLMDMVRTDAQPCSQDDQASAFMGKRIEAWPAPDGPDAQRWGACADELVHTLLVMVHIDGGEHVGRGGGEWNGKRGYDGQHIAKRKGTRKHHHAQKKRRAHQHHAQG